jgi:hypothetical protein
MAISPELTFRYEFSVRASGLEQRAWAGEGEGAGLAYFGPTEGLVGPKPRFELSLGWLTLSPTEGWTRSFPVRSFSDVRPRPWEMDKDARLAESEAHAKQFHDAMEEARKEAAARSVPGNYASFRKAQEEARERVFRRRGMTRDLVSYSVFVGEGLGNVLRTGDQFNFSRDGNGDFRYSVVRNSETIFSAGSVDGADNGKPVAVWQEYDKHPNPNAEDLKKKMPGWPIAEWIDVHRPYVTARVKEQVFHLLDGQEVDLYPFYVFLARSNQKVPPIAFEFTPRAVHSAGRLDSLRKELFIDAALQLTKPQTILL